MIKSSNYQESDYFELSRHRNFFGKRFLGPIKFLAFYIAWISSNSLSSSSFLNSISKNSFAILTEQAPSEQVKNERLKKYHGC